MLLQLSHSTSWLRVRVGIVADLVVDALMWTKTPLVESRATMHA